MTVKEPSVRKPRKPAKPKDTTEVVTTGGEVVSIAVRDETPDQKRQRLMAELAELGQPQQAQGPLGPNYWGMSHGQLKTTCIAKGIVDRTGTIEGMVSQLQQQDMLSGLQPHPRESAPAMGGLRAGNTPVHIQPHTRDAVRIIDNDGNEYAIIKRVGKMIDGNPVVLDMEGNARKFVAAMNEGRLA